MIHTLPAKIKADLQLKQALANQALTEYNDHLRIVLEMLGIEPDPTVQLDLAAGTITVPEPEFPTPVPERHEVAPQEEIKQDALAE